MKEKRRITSDGYFEVSMDGGKTYVKTTQRPNAREIAEWKAYQANPVKSTVPSASTTPTTKKGGIAEKVKFTARPVGEPTAEEDIIVPGTPKRAMPNITPLTSDEYAISQLQGKQTGQTPFEKSLTYDKTTPTARKYGSGLETLLGAAQAGYGLQQLMKDKRPVDVIDPTYSGLVDRAVTESRYGFSPEQKAALSQDIINTRIAQQERINQLAGGNAAVGLTNVRAALNQQYQNKLRLEAEDEQRRVQKAQYATGLAAQRAGMSRALFQDKMNEFMQKQQAGAELLGAGIQNVVGARRYQREREAQDQINKMMYGNTNLG